MPRDSRFPYMCRAVPLSSSVFHPACALSAPTGHLPLEGKALSVVILFSHMRVFALTLWRKRCSRIVAFPLRGRLTMRGKPAVKRSSGIAPYIFAAKPPPQPTTLNPEPRTLKSLVKQNPLTRAFSSCIITSVVVMNYVY